MENQSLAAVRASANGTTTLGAAGSNTILHRVLINKLGAAANIVTVTDVASNVVIAVIDTVTTPPRVVEFGGVRGRDGFTFVMGTGTTADITIVYE